MNVPADGSGDLCAVSRPDLANLLKFKMKCVGISNLAERDALIGQVSAKMQGWINCCVGSGRVRCGRRQPTNRERNDLEWTEAQLGGTGAPPLDADALQRPLGEID